jgi:2-polyprenyl-6-methoxyphenol hydroxylase-like FAD-dependent oxidoreductase
VLPEGAVDSPAGRKHDAAQTYSGWPESIPEVIEATPDDQIYRGDLYHRLPVKSWSKGRVTLLGDAAHPTMPAFGQGAGMAMEDSAVLARELGSVSDLGDSAVIAAALSRYEKPRITRTSGIVNQARIMAKMCTWKNPLAMTARAALISSLPNRLWERTYESEHSYRL